MGHAGLAVTFEPRTDEVGDVDGDLGIGGIREQQHVQAVRVRVLGDAFDRGDLLDTRRQGLGQRERGKQEERISPRRIASTNALQLASMTLSDTPTVDQLRRWSDHSIRTRTLAAVPLRESSTRTL